MSADPSIQTADDDACPLSGSTISDRVSNGSNNVTVQTESNNEDVTNNGHNANDNVNMNTEITSGSTDDANDVVGINDDAPIDIPSLPAIEVPFSVEDLDSIPELSKGHQFTSKAAMENTINSFLSSKGYVCKYEDGFRPDRKYPDYLIYRWRCQRSGKPSNKGTGQRKCISLKCDCKFKIMCTHPKTNHQITVILQYLK